MSRTKRTVEIWYNYWSYKSHSLKEFKNTFDDPENLESGYRVRSRHRKSGYLHSWDDKVPSAVHEVTHKEQTK